MNATELLDSLTVAKQLPIDADQETRFLTPDSVGLAYERRGSEYGDPDAYVPVPELVAALDAFFAAGGTVES